LSVDNLGTSSDPEAAPSFSHHLTFESLEMNYTTTDHRVIGDLSPPVGMTVWPDVLASEVVDTYMRYIDIRWRYSNGNVLFHKGGHPVLENCLAEWNDWSTVGGCIPGQYTGSSTLCIGGEVSHPHLILTSSSPHPHLILTSSSPHPHLILTSSSPHLDLSRILTCFFISFRARPMARSSGG
jgi:hypothetical protein